MKTLNCRFSQRSFLQMVDSFVKLLMTVRVESYARDFARLIYPKHFFCDTCNINFQRIHHYKHVKTKILIYAIYENVGSYLLPNEGRSRLQAIYKDMRNFCFGNKPERNFERHKKYKDCLFIALEILKHKICKSVYNPANLDEQFRFEFCIGKEAES